jgi:hypothetical protein
MAPILGIWASGATPSKQTSYESIATTTVGLIGATTVTFSSIPSTYQHLQLRCFINNTAGNISTSMQFNSDTGSNYAKHGLFGDGASATTAGSASVTSMTFQMYSGNTTNNYSATVIDILDYANTNKNKTVRGLTGYDNNGSGLIALGSGLWINTSAVSTITLAVAGSLWTQYSSFALYGIKG